MQIVVDPAGGSVSLLDQVLLRFAHRVDHLQALQHTLSQGYFPSFLGNMQENFSALDPNFFQRSALDPYYYLKAALDLIFRKGRL